MSPKHFWLITRNPTLGVEGNHGSAEEGYYVVDNGFVLLTDAQASRYPESESDGSLSRGDEIVVAR